MLCGLGAARAGRPGSGAVWSWGRGSASVLVGLELGGLPVRECVVGAALGVFGCRVGAGEDDGVVGDVGEVSVPAHLLAVGVGSEFDDVAVVHGDRLVAAGLGGPECPLPGAVGVWAEGRGPWSTAVGCRDGDVEEGVAVAA